MALPEVLPILTTERINWEIRPTMKSVEVVADDGTKSTVEREVYDWFAVKPITARLTAVCSPIEHEQLRIAQRIEDPEDRIEKVIELARVETWFRGQCVGGAEKIPSAHRPGLFTKIFQMSSLGADPFGVAPVGSQP